MERQLLTLCMLGNCSCFCCHLLTFFIITLFKKLFQEHYQSVSLGPDQDQHSVIVIWVQTDYKDYQRMTKDDQRCGIARKELKLKQKTLYFL